MRSWWRWGCVGLVALALSGCARNTPEQHLRATIASLQASIEARQTSAVKQVLAADFVGPDGLDRDGAVRLALAMFLRHRDVGVSIGPLQVQMQERNATVRFDVALTGGSGDLLPDAARLYSVETGWRLENGDWRLTSAQWTPRL